MYYEPDVCRFSEGFDNNCSRLCFVRRVFMILIVALLTMLSQILIVLKSDLLTEFFGKYDWIAFIGLTVFITVCMLLSCSNIARSRFPWNFILLIVLVESLTLILIVVAVKYSFTTVIVSIGCLDFLLMCLLILGLTVPIDFSKWTIVFVVMFLIVFSFAIIIIISFSVHEIPFTEILYAFFAVTFVSIAMLLNLQVLFNGSVFELYPEDFVLGAILMFADIIILFMCTLKLIGFDTDDY